MRNRVKIRLNHTGGWRTLWHTQLGEPCKPFYSINDAIIWCRNNNPNGDVIELRLRTESRSVIEWDNF